jgi:3',5'-nucleoside bisphosphate phosphatase
MLIDIHIHTQDHSPDADISAWEVINRARDAGLDGIVFTDHNYCWPEAELEPLRARIGSEFVLFSGAEVIFPDMHIIALGIPSGPIPVFNRPRDLGKYACQAGGCTVIAHPFSATRHLSSHQILQSGASGLEVFNARRKSFDMSAVFDARALDMAELGGSDTHSISENLLGMVATKCLSPVAVLMDLVNQIRLRQTRAVARGAERGTRGAGRGTRSAGRGTRGAGLGARDSRNRMNGCLWV